jgi:hypothetical protein
VKKILEFRDSGIGELRKKGVGGLFKIDSSF